METVTLVRIGRSARLERLLPAALAEFPVTELPAEQIASAAGRRLLFAVSVDAYGPDEAFVRLLRTLRQIWRAVRFPASRSSRGLARSITSTSRRSCCI